MIRTLAIAGIVVLVLLVVAAVVTGIVAVIRDRADDDRPEHYRGRHRAGHRPAPTPLAEVLLEDTAAHPLYEPIGQRRRSTPSPRPPMAAPVAGWVQWTSGEWRMRDAEVFGQVTW